VATEHDEQGVSTPDESPPPVDDGGGSGDAVPDDQGEQETFPRAYVVRLREEAAEHRTRAKRAEEAETRLRAAAVGQAAAGVLTDPTDLAWSEDLADEAGWPDPVRIRAAAEALVERKPYLGRPTGDVGQGRHSDQDDAVSLVSMLRAGA
jgi:hypothetical protein